MKCPACGNSEMVTNVQDETLSYGGQSLTLHAMKGDSALHAVMGFGMKRVIFVTPKRNQLLFER